MCVFHQLASHLPNVPTLKFTSTSKGLQREPPQLSRQHTSLHRDLARPRCLGQAQRLNQMLPSRPGPLFLLQVFQQLLPPMQQQSQIPLVHLVVPLIALVRIGQHTDLRRQHRNLHLRTPRVWPRARSRGRLYVTVLLPIACLDHGSGPGGEMSIRVVPPEFFDYALHVLLGAVLGGGVGEADESVDGLGGGGVALVPLLLLFGEDIGVLGVIVDARVEGVGDGGGEVGGVLEGGGEFGVGQAVVEMVFLGGVSG